MSEWISVDDRLPDEGSWVLAYQDGAVNCVAWYRNEWQDWVNGQCFNLFLSEISHWQPLPEPPK